MKKALLLILTLFILPNFCTTAFSKEKDDTLKQIEKIRKTQKAAPKKVSPKRPKPSEKLQRKRQEMREMRRKHKEMVDARKKARPTLDPKKAEALKKKIIHEEDKHRRRKARLDRIRQLALEQNATETVQRVDRLIRKEQSRYIRKQQKLRMQRQPGAPKPQPGAPRQQLEPRPERIPNKTEKPVE